MQNNRPIVIGLLAALGLFLLYLVILTLAESFGHALTQFAEMWYWIVILIIGFGIQLGLYAYIRINIRKNTGGTTAEVAASGSLSTGAMIACCAHHLTEILPLIGLSAAAVFLVKYQLSFIFLGIFSNLVGITMMLVIIQKHGLYPQKNIFNNLFSYSMQKVRNITMIFAVIGVTSSFLLTAVKTTAQEKAQENPVRNLPLIINDKNFVSIEIRPLDFIFNEPIRFEVGINTHRGDLNFDLTKISLLEDDQGNIFKPIGWEGSPPGGHHRSGILIFPGISEQTKWIKLIIKDVYDIPERIFKWELI